MDMDLNIDNYSIPELMIVLNLSDTPSKEEVIEKSEEFIAKFTEENKLIFADFFNKTKERIIEYLDSLDEWDDQYNVLLEKSLNCEYDKNILLNTEEPIIKENMCNVNINKQYHNVINRMIVINTEFVDIPYANTSTLTAKRNVGNFIFNLSEPISDVISISLYSFHIPYTWYSIDSNYGTNFFYILKSSEEHKIEITSGVYTNKILSEEINKELQLLSSDYSCLYNEINGKITLNFTSDIISIKFYKEEDSSKLNQNLGYILGFRDINYYYIRNMNNNTWNIESEGVCNVSGTKYLQLMINDYNNNRLNTNIINTISNKNDNIKPSTVFADLERNQYNEVTITNPQTLTEVDRAVINRIEKDNNNNSTFLKTKISSGSDIFAMIPTKHHNLNLGDVCVEYGGTMQNNKRAYYGPITLSRMHIQLLDDKGNIINLNENDWSFTIICETLYEGNQKK